MSRAKPGGMGPLFAKLLAAYESCERALMDMQPVAGSDDAHVTYIDARPLGVAVETISARAQAEGHPAHEYLPAIIERWGNDAGQLRSAFKFKTTHADLEKLANFENPDLVMRLPFDECVVVVSDVHALQDADTGIIDEGVKGVCLFVENRICVDAEERDWYQQNDIANGDQFICATACVEIHDKQGKQFCLLPAEYHLTQGDPLDGPHAGRWCTALPPHTPNGTQEMLEGFGALVMMFLGGWVAAINNPAVKLKPSQQGLKPGVKHSAPKRKGERRFYEHKLVVIDPLKERPPEAVGSGSGREHRLHPVRGFWRRYKNTGKVVWVKAHWRGNKDLGVITHDYEVSHDDD